MGNAFRSCLTLPIFSIFYRKSKPAIATQENYSTLRIDGRKRGTRTVGKQEKKARSDDNRPSIAFYNVSLAAESASYSTFPSTHQGNSTVRNTTCMPTNYPEKDVGIYSAGVQNKAYVPIKEDDDDDDEMIFYRQMATVAIDLGTATNQDIRDDENKNSSTANLGTEGETRIDISTQNDTTHSETQHQEIPPRDQDLADYTSSYPNSPSAYITATLEVPQVHITGPDTLKPVEGAQIPALEDIQSENDIRNLSENSLKAILEKRSQNYKDSGAYDKNDLISQVIEIWRQSKVLDIAAQENIEFQSEIDETIGQYLPVYAETTTTEHNNSTSLQNIEVQREQDELKGNVINMDHLEIENDDTSQPNNKDGQIGILKKLEAAEENTVPEITESQNRIDDRLLSIKSEKEVSLESFEILNETEEISISEPSAQNEDTSHVIDEDAAHKQLDDLDQSKVSIASERKDSELIDSSITADKSEIIIDGQSQDDPQQLIQVDHQHEFVGQETMKSKGSGKLAPSKNKCILCNNAKADCVVLECGHLSTCYECGKDIKECPVCHNYIKRSLRIYRS